MILRPVQSPGHSRSSRPRAKPAAASPWCAGAQVAARRMCWSMTRLRTRSKESLRAPARAPEYGFCRLALDSKGRHRARRRAPCATPLRWWRLQMVWLRPAARPARELWPARCRRPEQHLRPGFCRRETHAADRGERGRVPRLAHPPAIAGTMLMASPAFTGVLSPSRKRTSSSPT